MWSTLVGLVLGSLRYLAPAALLPLLWGEHSFFSKLIKYIDSAFRSVVYSSDEQKQTVLQWLETAGTVRVDKLETVWRHGWIICGVLDIAIPGTCTGHPPTKLSLKHAQSIAKEYLGVEPVFTPQELESIDTLGKHQEWKLITFLDNIREALVKITPPPKPSPIRFAAESTQHTFDYIAKGSGLVAAQIKNKAFFKIYPTAQQSLNPGDINIEIKGPNKSHGTLTLPAVLGKAQVIRQSLLGRKATTNYTENILPLTQGASYLRNFGKNDMSKTYFIPKLKSNIDIDSETNDDHVKISYTVEYEGKYEISITSKNLSIAGSPFSMVASNDIVETLENDNFTLEDGEEIDIVDVSTDKKAVIRIVDFVTEKMLLKEDGCLQKITADEAKQLMEACNKEHSTIDEDKEQEVISTANTDIGRKALKLFYEASRKIIIMLRVSKCFMDYKRILKTDEVSESGLRNQDIPDVVNSTLNDYHVKTGFVPTVSDRYIIPKPISVSLKTEKLNKSLEKEPESKINNMVDNYGPLYENIFDDATQNLSNNPFTDDAYVQSYTIEKKLGSFIPTEYETNNSHTEELQNESVPSVNKENDCYDQTPNSFTDVDKLDFSKLDYNSIEQKKSLNPFDDPKYEDYNTSENQTEFLIGAPVSLPPSLVTTSINSINTVASNTSSDTASCDRSETNDNFTQDVNLNNTNFTTISPNKDMWDSAYVSIDDNNSSDVTISECPEEKSYKQKQFFVSDKTPTTESLRERLLHDIRERSFLMDSDNSKKKYHEPKKHAFSPIREENDKYEMHTSINNDDFMMKSETDSVTEAFAELDDIYDDYFSEEVHNLDKNVETSSVSVNHTRECKTLVDSASENVSDVKRQTTTSEGRTSEIQANVTESVSASQILRTGMTIEENNNERYDETQFGDKIYNNIVIEKKLYWDEKIRQIQAKEQELKSLKRRLSSKYLRRNDSLTKKRGKKIIKNFLKSAEKETGKDDSNTNSELYNEDSIFETSHNKAKLKDSLRNYWDSKVQAMDSCFGKKTEKDVEHTRVNARVNIERVNNEKAVTEYNDHDLGKQELPEKVFEAFETSPKRFFGTSRQQILNKIDTYLGKSEQEDETKSINSEISHDSGLVSSRISLFHNIAETESAPSPFRKHKSLNNIYTEKVSMHNKNYNLHEHQNLLETNDNESTNSKIGKVDQFGNKSYLIKEPIVSFQVNKLEGNENMKIDSIKAHTPVDIEDNENRNFNEDAAERNDHVETDRNTLNQNSEEPDSYDCKNSNRKGSLLRNNLNSFSKSEMDIFSKTSKTIDIDLDIHKSFEELPKNSVKKFISLYEDVSKSSDQTNLIGSCKKNRKILGNVRSENESSTGGTAREPQSETQVQVRKEVEHRNKTKTISNDKKFESENTTESGLEVISIQDKHTSRLSLSDMDIEIIESPDTTEKNPDDKLGPDDYVDYKNRFKMAKQYFKSLEEFRIDKKSKEVKENVISMTDIPEESLDKKEEKEKEQIKKSNIKKSHSMPSSEISKIWNQMQEENNISPKRLMKISEKFNVDDLYEDVMEGRLSRQGSLRGIPNKKAVLETFRSMENMTHSFSSYEFATSQAVDFEKENRTRQAQTYLSEYPYLPTTDPSKFHSRLDASASGLITFKELKELKHKKTYRRNSVPNSSIHPIFTEKL